MAALSAWDLCRRFFLPGLPWWPNLGRWRLPMQVPSSPDDPLRRTFCRRPLTAVALLQIDAESSRHGMRRKC